MTSLDQRTKDKSNQKTKGDSQSDFVLFVVLMVISVTAILASYVAVLNYREYVDPNRVYGKWTEIGAPSWLTDRFVLSADGVMVNSRFIASSFDFDGSVVSFSTGDEKYSYLIIGKHDERLKRVSGGGYVAAFIKHGYEDTLPKEENAGAARRVSLAEHFQSKK